MRLRILRHGATAANEAHRYLGLTDEPLSALGRVQCQRLGADTTVGTVYVSRLLRARQSAELCFPAARVVPVDGLEEFDFGAFEGRSAAEMADDQAYRAWVDGGCVGRCPGGDARASYVARVAGAFGALARAALRRGERELAIVAHGGTIMAVLSAYADATREGVAGYDDYFCWQVGPAAGYEARVLVRDGALRIEDVRPLARLVPVG